MTAETEEGLGLDAEATDRLVALAHGRPMRTLVVGPESKTACTLDLVHNPKPRMLHWHHVFPVGWGGPETGPRVLVCPTCHANIHLALEQLRAKSGAFAREFNPETLELAKRGWQAWIAAGSPQ